MKKKVISLLIALLLLLSICNTEAKDYTYGIYRFTFRVSGGITWGWDFAYTYQGEQISSGHRILFSLELFTFHTVQVTVTEKADPTNSYTAEFRAAICDGGGHTDITVTNSKGKTTTFQITCKLKQVGKQ